MTAEERREKAIASLTELARGEDRALDVTDLELAYEAGEKAGRSAMREEAACDLRNCQCQNDE